MPKSKPRARQKKATNKATNKATKPAPFEGQCTETTAKGARCRRSAAPGVDICSGHLLGRAGRPTKLDDAITKSIVDVLRFGGFVETAAAAAGVSRSTFHAWVERGHPDGVKTSDSEDAPRRLRREDAPFREFRERIEKAKAEGEAHAVELIAKAGVKDWRAMAWMLERQYPDRWGGALDRNRLDSGARKPDGDDEAPKQQMTGPDGAAL